MTEPTQPVADAPAGSDPAEPTTPPVVDEPDTFPRAVVEDLRRENAEHRTKAARADKATAALVDAYAASAGLLADPSDLARYADPGDLVDDDGVPDADRIREAVQTLVTERPHLRTRRPAEGTDVGQGARNTTGGAFDVSDVMRSLAGG